jgi:hypothetical protein
MAGSCAKILDKELTEIVNRLNTSGNRSPCRAAPGSDHFGSNRPGPAFAGIIGVFQLAVAIAAGAAGTAKDATRKPQTSEAKAARLIAAYPDHLARFEGNHIVWRDGTRMQFDDGRGPKSLDRLLTEPDLEDIFAFDYPAGPSANPPPRDYDPGRIRPEAFFAKMYGDCRTGGVQSKLVGVDWLKQRGGGRVLITTVNRAHERLAAASRELERLPAELTRFLIPSSGTFNCRPIAGTNRLSMHAYGAAIDISARHGDYWRWSKAARSGQPAYRNRIPMEIVNVFERHGFIWGGKWHHFDTMHFEYRPELLN